LDVTAAVVLIPVFAVFLPALVLPGPDFVGVARSSLTRGTRAGLATTAGVTVGLGLYATLSLVGLAALLVQYQWLAVAVRVLGGCYLVYLGVRLVLTRAEPVAIDAAGTAAPGGARRSFLFGLGVTLTNPKAMVLFAAVFAPAVTATTPAWVMAAMVVLVMLAAAVWYAVVALVVSAPPVIRRCRAVQHWIERAAGACFIVIGGRVVIDARSPVAP
jgi:threonine/homoserine/homoserine lactone efflux protein